MISVHVSGVGFALSQLGPGQGLVKRVALSFLTFIGLTLLIYLPLHQFVTRHLFMPLRVDGQVVVVSCRTDLTTLRVGDQIAYRIDAGGWSGVNIAAAGYAMGEIRAAEGESIRFTRGGCQVGPRVYARLADMPENETWIVPENRWFVWPELGRSLMGRGAREQLAKALRNLAMVNEDHILGRPFKRWFWREQRLP